MISNVTASTVTLVRPTGTLFQDRIAELKQGAGNATPSPLKSLEAPTLFLRSEAIAAIQQPANGDAEGALSGRTAADLRLANPQTRSDSSSAKPARTWLEAQAEAQRWERYFAHQPQRLADLLAVYYGGRNPIEPIGHLADAPDEETKFAAATGVHASDDTQPRDN